MADNDIKKALECCCKGDKKDCFECPLQNSWDCHKELREKALDLINRQKAEIERLQKAGEEAVSCFTRMESLYKIKCKELEVAKTEAIKEFAERLKKEIAHIPAWGRVAEKKIDNLVKEMTEVSE